MHYQIVGPIRDVETIAEGRGIRELSRLNRDYGKGRWRKLKGVATVVLKDGSVRNAEMHWYQAHGIGKRAMKLKRYLDS